MQLSDLVFYRIPSQSKGFWRAQLADALGAAALLGAVYPFAGVISRRMGASPMLITLLSMAPFIGAMFTPVVARARAYVRMGIVLAVLRVLSAGVVMSAVWAYTPAMLVSVVLLSQVFRVGGSVGINSLMRSHVVTRARPGVMQAARIVMFTATLPAAYVAGRALDALGPGGYRTVFPIAGAVSIFLAIPFFFLPRRPRELAEIAEAANASETPETTEPEAKSLFAEIGVLKRDKRFAAFLLFFFVGALGEKITMPVNPIYFADVLDLTNEDVALAMGIIGPLLAVLGFLVLGQLFKRVNPLPVLAACMIFKAGRPVLWAVATEFDSPLMLICIGEGLFRFFIAGIEMGVLLSIMRMSSSQEISLYMGIHFFLMAVRGIGGPLVGLALLNAGVSIAGIYWIVSGVVLLGGAMLAGLAVAWRGGGIRGDRAVMPADGGVLSE